MPSDKPDPISELERVARELSDAPDFEEVSEITAVRTPSVHVHLDRDSIADAEERPRGLAGWLKLAIAALGAGATMAIVSAVEQCSHHAR